VPDFVGSSTEVAVTISPASVSAVLTITMPLLVIVVADGTPPTPSSFHVTSWLGLPVPRTVALKVAPSPLFICGFTGVKVTLVTVGIVTVIEADFVVFTAEVAVTYNVAAASVAATVSVPLDAIAVPSVTAPSPAALELTFHVTFWPGLLFPATTAVNLSLPPLSALAVPPSALTVTLVTVMTLISLTSNFVASELDTALT